VAQIYSSVFAEVKELATSHGFVTNGGVVTVVRCVDVYHGFQAEPVRGRIVGPGGAAFFGFYSRLTEALTAPAWFGWRGRQVFGPEQLIEIFMEAGNADWRMSGYELKLP
jgi:hypothetical protein